MTASEIVIVGAGGHAREVLGILDEMNRTGTARWTIRGFVDDDPELQGDVIDGRRVLGGTGWLAGVLAAAPAREWPLAVCALGSPAVRRRVVLRLRELGLGFAAAVSPAASIASSARLGTGCMVFPGAVIGPGVVVGEHAVVNAGCTVSHECTLGDYVTLAPGVHLAGNTAAAEGCDIGIGAVTVQGVRLGAWSILGAGTVALRDIPANTTAVGAPARVIKTREDKWYDS